MAEPTTPDIELTQTYGDLADDYARQQIDREWDAFKQRQSQEQAAAAAPAPEEQPSALGTAVSTLGASASQAGENIVRGVERILLRLPVAEAEGTTGMAATESTGLGEKVQGARQALVEGLMALGFSPLTAAGAGLRQGLQNVAPEVAGVEVSDGAAAAGIRALLGGGKALADMTPEERTAAMAPITVGEAIEMLTPFLAPIAAKGAAKNLAKGAVKGIEATREQMPNIRSERGSIGRARVARTPEEYAAKPWYHGTNEPGLTAQSMDATVTRAEGLFGQGVYLTDNPNIARGYAGARSRRGGTPTIYEVRVSVDRVLDLEGPLPPEVKTALLETARDVDTALGGDVEAAVNAAAQKGGPAETVWRAFSTAIEELSHQEQIPAGEFVEDFGRLSGRLRRLGYDALTHTGGKRTGNVPHQVLILLDPADVESTGRPGGLASVTPFHGGGERGSIGPPPEPGSTVPPVPKGTVRFYHGGVPGEGPRWVSPDLAYAEGYARKSPGGIVQYVDIPESSSLLIKAHDDTGLTMKAPYLAFEAPAGVMKGARPMPQAEAPPAGAGAAGPPAVPPPPPPPGGAGPGPPGPEGVGPGRINLGRVEATDATKRVMLAINRLVGEREPAKGSRETVSHAETIAASRAWTLPKLMLLNPDELPLGQLRAVQLAARDHFNAASAHLDDVLTRRRAGEPAADAEFWPALTVAAKLAELEQIAGTETARTLESRKILSEAPRAGSLTPEQMTDLAQRMADGMGGDVAAAAARVETLKTKAQRAGYLGNVMTALRTGRDIFHEIWINSLLTNPVTHSANVTGTGLSLAWNLPEHYTAEIINRLFFRDPEGVQRGETAAMVAAIPDGISNGIRLAGKALKGEKAGGIDAQLLQQTRVEQGPALTAQNVGLSPDSVPGQAIDVLGSAIRVPTGLLGVEDGFFKGVSYTTELASLALREARAEGRTGPALERRVGELTAHPTAPMLKDAVDLSMLRTLNAELGPTGQAFMKWANSLPGGRVIMPFVRTPTNIAKWMGQRAPVLAQLSAQNWRDIQAGGALRDKAIARQVLGGAISAVIAYEVAQGNITGGGDPDRRIKSLEREERPAYSIKVGNTYYQYSRLDPVGGLIGAIADYTELTGRIPTQDDLDEWAAYGEGLALAVGNTMVNKTYMRGLADVLDAIKQPDRDAARVAKGFARSLVPAGVRAITRATDDQIVRDAQTVVDQVRSGIPGLVEGVPPARNPITGEPFRYPVGWGSAMLNPIFMTEKKNDPVLNEVIANRIGLSPVPWYVGPGERTDSPLMMEPRGGGPAVKLTPKQHDYWIVAMTQLAKDGEGRTLHEALTDLVQSSRYQDQSKGPGGGREMMVKAIYSAYKDRGEQMLRQESATLEGRVRENMQRQLERKLPVTDPRSRPPETTRQGAGALIRSLGQ